MFFVSTFFIFDILFSTNYLSTLLRIIGQTGVAKPASDPHPKKVMLSVWWWVSGIICWEILLNSCTITADIYSKQSDRVVEKLKGKQDRVHDLHDTARSYVARSVCEKFFKLEWITIVHLPHSPNWSTMDYHLFRSLSNHLRVKEFHNENNVKVDLVNFFGQTFQGFYECGIRSLPEHWRQFINNSDAYIIENYLYCWSWKIKIKFLEKTQKPCC